MNSLENRATVKSELDRVTLEFFRSVSFAPGSAPEYQHIHTLFVEQGLLIKNVAPRQRFQPSHSSSHHAMRACASAIYLDTVHPYATGLEGQFDRLGR